MFPLRAVHKTAKAPWMTRLLVVANVLAFCFQALPWERALLVYEMGVKPRCYFSPGSCGISVPGETQLLWQPLFVSLFLHGGLLHLAFNMLFLWVFGPGLEERLGKWKFLMFYLGCGIVASLAHIVTHPFSNAPAIGASGAISGVLGAYLILLPRSWILTYFPPIFLFPVPAPLFLVLWILSQVLSFFTNLPWIGTGASNIAWTAHIGGFLFGAMWAWTIKPWWKKKADGAL
jgi:membrane associated rhomboid family serine protease